jgi:gas vesicle structural protein
VRGDLPDLPELTPLGRASASSDDMGLVDLLDRVLDRGVVIVGDVTLSIADVDLVNLSLRLTLTSVEGPTRRR